MSRTVEPNVGSQSLIFGARAEQVDEHLDCPFALFIFEHKCYPEAKILSGVELRGLYRDLLSWVRVAETIGSSEAFARQKAARRN